MKSPEQLKGKIRSISENNNLRSQEVLQMYLFERILERLARSQYKNNFILKGGLLISSMIGVNERTTLDMDTTVRGIKMEKNNIIEIIKNILSVPVEDEINFTYESIEPIREHDAYNNFRVHIKAKYGKINAPMKIDITTGDSIIPEAIHYEYPLVFENRKIKIMAYALETVLAEKYETIIRRNISTTRARDYYDLHMLYRLHRDELQMDILREAVIHTATKRGSIEEIYNWQEILEDIANETILHTMWERYRKENTYAREYSFDDVLQTVEIMAMDLKL